LKETIINNERLVSSSRKSNENIVIEKRTPTPKTNAITPLVPNVTTNNYYTQPKTETAQKIIRDTIEIQKKITSDYDELVKKYSKTTENILFDNNSAEVKTTYFETLDQLVVLCNSNAKIDFYLKGGSSKKEIFFITKNYLCIVQKM
jgi:outer membrane protein OmpA-like peptidoglycan-associated protein